MTQTNIYHLIDDYIANIVVLHIKLKNMHWNIVGTDFLVLHEYTDELHNHVYKKVDAFGEIMKMQKQRPTGSLSEYLKMAEIKDLSNMSLDTTRALAVLKADFEILKQKAAHLRGAADVDANYTLATLLDEELLFLDKHLWFIESMQS
jgi:starvation-inducible DNA-binding protein